MKKNKSVIKVKWAKWRVKDKFDFGQKHDIMTIVLKQKCIYFDPSDEDFLDKIFKEYVRKTHSKRHAGF